MKIGIITLPLHTNYGGILQAYALQKILMQLGHKAYVVDKDPIITLPTRTKYLIYLKRAFLRYIKRIDVELFPDKAHNQQINTIRQHTNKFIEKYIKRRAIKDVTEIKESDFDCFVVGSDQIWRCIYNRYFPGTRNAFLDFTKDWNVKRIAYAASFGTDEWEYNETDTHACAALAKRFNAISVREASAVKICNEKLGVNAEHLLDPTMLLKVEEYIKLFQDVKTPASNGGLMCYILDKNKDTNTIISNIKEKTELTAFYTNSRIEDPFAPIEECIQPPVEEWLRGFYDAKFVVTDSFHACVFSILFKKPFIVYSNKTRGKARFTSLLTTFGLEDRLVHSPHEVYAIFSKTINWENIDKILIEQREKATKFISNNIQVCKRL